MLVKLVALIFDHYGTRVIPKPNPNSNPNPNHNMTLTLALKLSGNRPSISLMLVSVLDVEKAGALSSSRLEVNLG